MALPDPVHDASSPIATPVVDEVDRLTPDTFRKDYFQPKRPVWIRDMGRHWPAVGKWSLPFFRDLAHDRQVRLEQGNVLQGDTNFSHGSFRDYIDRLMAGEKPAREKGAPRCFRWVTGVRGLRR